jgi:hypothetical protein
MPRYKTRMRVLRAEREWSQAKLAEPHIGASAEMVDDHNGLISLVGFREYN